MKHTPAFFLLAALTLLVGSSVGSAVAQDSPLGTHGSENRWAAGTSITYPLGAQIYMVQVSYSTWPTGDVLFGGAFQNWENDQGRSNAYTALLGYRHFLWRGLHAEIELWPAYNPFESSVDRETYAGLELWTSLRLGYRIDMGIAGQDFFVLAQPSFGFGVARQNPWPEIENGGYGIFEPQLIIGIRF